MTNEEIHAKLQKGCDDIEAGNVQNAAELLAPENAIGQYNRIADEILKLESFPERFKIMDSEPEHTKEIRRIPQSLTKARFFFIMYKSDSLF